MPVPKAVRDELHQRWKGPPSPYREALSYMTGELRNHVIACKHVSPEQEETRVSGRIKTIPRIVEKVDRSGRRLVSTIDELEEIVTDIVGVRVTVDYLRQSREIQDFVINYSGWEAKKSDDSLRDSGYRAIHVDVMTNTTHFAGVRCEVQIRTLLQDAWAIWSHPLYERYRRDLSRIPRKKRELMRQLSDMLHTADEMVETLLK